MVVIAKVANVKPALAGLVRQSPLVQRIATAV